MCFLNKSKRNLPVEKRMKHSNYQTFCQPTMVIQNLFKCTYQSFLILRDQHYHPLHSFYLHDISPPWRWINTRLSAVVSLLTALLEDAHLPSLYHHRINLSLWIDEERILVNHSCIGSIHLFSVIFVSRFVYLYRSIFSISRYCKIYLLSNSYATTFIHGLIFTVYSIESCISVW
jgi:hypothetical protein